MERQLQIKSKIYMDTVVTLKVSTILPQEHVEEKMNKAYTFFKLIEERCSRFDPDSELKQLSGTCHEWVEVSDLLFQLLHFSLKMAEQTDGAFDPAIGSSLVAAGFHTNYLTREAVVLNERARGADYRHIHLNRRTRSVRLTEPMDLDLGAVAKGLAIDLAARELNGFEGFVVEAGGDLFVKGEKAEGLPWEIGIQHPFDPQSLIGMWPFENQAICTSGGYERKSPIQNGSHHLIDPRKQTSPREVVSVTVTGSHAMLADAVSTSIFIMGWQKGLELARSTGCEAMIMTRDQHIHTSKGFGGGTK